MVIKLKNILEYKKLTGAGIIPFFEFDSKPKILCIQEKPNEPLEIAKGHIEFKEDPLLAAFREGKEELGLKRENIEWHKPLGIFKLMIVYYCKIINPENFLVPGHETYKTRWTNNLDDINPEQHEIVNRVFEKIENYVQKIN